MQLVGIELKHSCSGGAAQRWSTYLYCTRSLNRDLPAPSDQAEKASASPGRQIPSPPGILGGQRRRHLRPHPSQLSESTGHPRLCSARKAPPDEPPTSSPGPACRYIRIPALEGDMSSLHWLTYERLRVPSLRRCLLRRPCATATAPSEKLRSLPSARPKAILPADGQPSASASVFQADLLQHVPVRAGCRRVRTTTGCAR